MTIPSHSRATTRTTREVHRPRAHTARLLAHGEILVSPELGLRCQVDRLLGEGGFGQVYLTGILSQPRREAIAAAKRAGAIVHSGPSSLTTVVVRGRPNPQQAAGRDAGLKPMEIKRLRAAGHRITLLSDEQFWRLARRVNR